MLELYCELLLARSQLLDPPTTPYSNSAHTPSLDPALEEAVRSIIYAASRTDIKELHTARNLLIEKFGKEIAVASMEGEGVAERVLNKLKLETPKAELVDAYLTEIARFYGVPYGEPAATEEEDDDDDDPSAGIAELAEEVDAEPQLEPELATESRKDKQAKKEDEREELVKATPPKQFGPQSPLRITPPSPSVDNIAPRLKLPGAVAAKAKAAEVKKAPIKRLDDGPGGKIPDVDELAKRFAQLKR
jgi:vacuolar protein sorting-associated protein IST1